jgi:hypothetical protein
MLGNADFPIGDPKCSSADPALGSLEMSRSPDRQAGKISTEARNNRANDKGNGSMKVSSLFATVATLAICAVSVPAFAQSAPADGATEEEGLGDIVVTAQRRSESLIVPRQHQWHRFEVVI